ncbi:MAG TPA: MerR family transcriptional regulator [Telluria sp.]|nr:MerR family transcriptional regulator [Telluria sp.]
MNNAMPPLLSIAAVEQDTGIGKDTLRAWERRYGFPVPQRDQRGERLYPLPQVERLRLIRRLLDRGMRPGGLVGLEHGQLLALEQQAKPARAAEQGLLDLLDLCHLPRAAALRRGLTEQLIRLGLHQFIVRVGAPLCEMVGTAWARGELEVWEEHLFTEAMQNVLRAGIATLPPPADAARPRILLATLPQEQHALGILMAEALCALEGAFCMALGARVPLGDIARAASACDIVALSFSAAYNAQHAVRNLDDLISQLPPAVEVWAGGTCAALTRPLHARIRRLSLDDIAAQIARWRLHGT